MFSHYFKLATGVASHLSKLIYQSLWRLKRGDLFGSIYCFLVLNKVSLLPHKPYSNKNLKHSRALVDNSYLTLQPLAPELVAALSEYFLSKISPETTHHQNLEAYFNSQRNENFIRSNPVSINNERNLINSIFNTTLMDQIACHFLDLPPNQVLLSASIQSMTRIDLEDKPHKNDYGLEFHRDTECEKIVKGFIYLNDIDYDYGHHELYPGTEKDLPLALKFNKNYSESELDNYEEFDKKVKIIGKSGFAFMVNVMAFHRGTRPTKGDRLCVNMILCDKKSASILFKNNDYYVPLEKFKL